MALGVIVMARRKAQRHSPSGAPGIKAGMGPALNPTTYQQRGKYNYLDPTAALGEVPHPSAEWADVELQPIKPRV